MMKGYKTLVVNGAVAAAPLIDRALNNGQLLGVVLGPYGAEVVSVLGLINIVLRWVTTTPVLKAE